MNSRIKELKEMLEFWMNQLNELEMNGETEDLDFGSIVQDIEDSVQSL